ncbi:MAG TPA: FkbM family methyltransferase [Tepidisphaeraceae bacterium]|nr:FkbM family methyltransferase [Tepidisphaeraceae bacterium]
MLTSLISYVRSRLHPLHRMRRSKYIRPIIKSFDWTVCADVGISRPIYLKALTHAPYYMLKDRLDMELRRTFSVLVASIGRGGIFFDVGANLGIFSWLALSERPDIKVISIEPDPRLASLMVRTSTKWMSAAHHIIPKAVADRVERREFELDETTTATGRLVANTNAPSFQEAHFGVRGKVISVDTITLDKLAQDFGVPDIIKIDVEGAEQSVLDGAAKLFAAARPILLLESFPPQSDGIHSKLKRLGYQLFDAERHQEATKMSTNIAAVPIAVSAHGLGNNLYSLMSSH